MYFPTVAAHEAWWGQYPGHYEHWRFGEGFVRGWDDAYAFLSAPPAPAGTITEIGYKGPWTKRRSAEHAQEKGGGNVWEFGAC